MRGTKVYLLFESGKGVKKFNKGKLATVAQHALGTRSRAQLIGVFMSQLMRV